MEQRELGSTGLRVSALGFGCGAVGGLMTKGDPAEQRQAVERALAAGITYFDTAADYGSGRSEENLGRVMRELGAWSRVVVGTKTRLSTEQLSDAPAAIRASLEASLRRLGRDNVDVFHLHNPVALIEDLAAGRLGLGHALGDVAQGLRAVKEAGLARHVGFTGLGDATALRELLLADTYETVQAYFNLLNPSAGYTGHAGGGQDFEGLIDTAARAGKGVINIRVLAAGAASGSLERDPNASPISMATLTAGSEFEHDAARAQELAEVAKQSGVKSTVELAFRFGLAKAGVSTVLVGFSNRQQLEDAIRWAERGPLAAEAVQRLVELAA